MRTLSLLKPILISVVLLLLLFLLVAPSRAQGPAPQTQGGPPDEAPYVPGEILVKFKSNVRTLDAERSLRSNGLRAVKVSKYNGVIRAEVKPGQEDQAIAKLMSRNDVEYAELNYMAYATYIPNDNNYGSQWGLPKINMPEAWDITLGDNSITVAVVDTGIDLDHPDFSCTVGGETKLTNGWNFIAGNSNPDDDNSHGSHVAGIIGACTNNTTGVAGMAPNVRLMPVKVLNSGGGGTYEGVADGIIYAVNEGADIINLSLGGRGNNTTLADAVQYAYDNGVLVVTAAGNCAQQVWSSPCDGYINPIMYPAAYAGTMAVAATDSSDNWANFSGYQPYVEVAAPGVSIYSTWAWGSYGSKSGTSMSTPYVSGLAALILAVDPGLTHNEVRQIIQSTAKDLGDTGWDQYYGYGRINAQLALESYGLETSPDQVAMLMDDNSGSVIRTIDISTASSASITWTAGISASASWLSMEPPPSGMISAASGPDQITVVATNTLITHGTYTATVLITGTTASGGIVGPNQTEVRLTYVPELYDNYLPLIFKN